MDGCLPAQLSHSCEVDRHAAAGRGQGRETGEDAVQRAVGQGIFFENARQQERAFHVIALSVVALVGQGGRRRRRGVPVEDHRAPSFHGSLPTRHVTARRLG